MLPLHAVVSCSHPSVTHPAARLLRSSRYGGLPGVCTQFTCSHSPTAAALITRAAHGGGALTARFFLAAPVGPASPAAASGQSLRCAGRRHTSPHTADVHGGGRGRLAAPPPSSGQRHSTPHLRRSSKVVDAIASHAGGLRMLAPPHGRPQSPLLLLRAYHGGGLHSCSPALPFLHSCPPGSPSVRTPAAVGDSQSGPACSSAAPHWGSPGCASIFLRANSGWAPLALALGCSLPPLLPGSPLFSCGHTAAAVGVLSARPRLHFNHAAPGLSTPSLGVYSCKQRVGSAQLILWHGVGSRMPSSVASGHVDRPAGTQALLEPASGGALATGITLSLPAPRKAATHPGESRHSSPM